MHHIAWAKAFEQAAHQREFATAFAAVWPSSRSALRQGLADAHGLVGNPDAVRTA